MTRHESHTEAQDSSTTGDTIKAKFTPAVADSPADMIARHIVGLNDVVPARGLSDAELVALMPKVDADLTLEIRDRLIDAGYISASSPVLGDELTKIEAAALELVADVLAETRQDAARLACAADNPDGE